MSAPSPTASRPPASPPARVRRRRIAAGRGSLNRPGADLRRLPTGLDLRNVRLVEGVRAAFAFGVVILINIWLQWPPLLTMALAANLACFCDNGGPMRVRLRVLTAFSVLGGLLWAGLGLIQPLGLAVVVPVACALIFACSYARVWSVQAQAAGNVLVVVLCIALDRPLTLEQAGTTVLMFAAGGLWATFLALVIWRLHPYRPAHRAVAEVWRDLARLCGDLERLIALPEPDTEAFDGHARGHRRGVRTSIETARAMILDLARSRERVSDRTAQALLRLESAEQIFSALIAVGELIDSRPDAHRRTLAKVFLRRLRPLLVTIARAIRDDVALDLARLEHSIARTAEGLAEDPTLARLAERIVGRVRIGAKLSTPEGYRPGGTLMEGGSLGRWTRYLGPLRQNFTLASPNLRHALRASAVSAPALAATLSYAGAFTHWLVMTVVLTMQPFYAATWQRALERIGGTVLGGLVGAVLAYYATTPLAEAGLILVLSIVGFAARQISYGFFIACLTPLVVLLVELLEPGHSSWEIVAMRGGFTVLGGVIAVASCLVLWPIWEPDQVRQELRRALKAHAVFAQAVLRAPTGSEREAAILAGARAAGLALNDLEAALSRALQQPRAGHHPEVESALVADATLRRISARLTVLRHAPEAVDPSAEPWRAWIAATLAALGEDRPLPEQPALDRGQSLVRLVSQVDLLVGTLRPGEIRGGAPVMVSKGRDLSRVQSGALENIPEPEIPGLSPENPSKG
ncbi:FUSC family protein [Methylobacterium sp. J-088]|uniref:FUSC family protein n=1 Tax=Methylobacterium sp. GC_Met_2 TaxID=2937376 RepID=UPI001FBB4686|nr:MULTISPECIES: FUSC family protein [unclassified Methylobacterium]MCJ2062741.1 FUSC family protein [Methylobacterium sp. J-088]